MGSLTDEPKEDAFSILNSPIPHKNTSGAVRYCESLGLSYNLVSSPDYREFLKKLAQCDKYVFIPQTPETLSRVAVEARMMGMEVHTTPQLGATSEAWFSESGHALIDIMRRRAEEITDAVEEVFETGRCGHYVPPRQTPKISIITSMYNGDSHIEGFLKNIVRQSIFELSLIHI